MFVAILPKMWDFMADIQSDKFFQNPPSWINDCLDVDIRPTEAQIENSAYWLNDLRKEIVKLSVLMIIFIIQDFFVIILLLYWVTKSCCKGEVKTNFRAFGKEATSFFKLYMLLN